VIKTLKMFRNVATLKR